MIGMSGISYAVASTAGVAVSWPLILGGAVVIGGVAMASAAVGTVAAGVAVGTAAGAAATTAAVTAVPVAAASAVSSGATVAIAAGASMQVLQHLLCTLRNRRYLMIKTKGNDD